VSHPSPLVGVTTCVGFEDYLECSLPRNRPSFDEFIVVTAPGCTEVLDLCRQHGATA
jgi:hypothetical protein